MAPRRVRPAGAPIYRGQLELRESQNSGRHHLTKNRVAFVLIGSITRGILRELIGCIEPSWQQARHLSGPGF
jgi:hypothetical protein